MQLPDSYTIKPNAIPAYFNALLNANPPERFSIKFLENLGFASTNDRLFIGILKDLAFINKDSIPQQRYFEFMDRSRSKTVLADALRGTYTELFAINRNANGLGVKDVKNKLRTLYAGKKTDLVIGNIAKTFVALCQYADFSEQPVESPKAESSPDTKGKKKADVTDVKISEMGEPQKSSKTASLSMESLQYHINIVLPESRDQAVYDAIFKSLKEHLT
jgi:hypothetical protein